ncbi:MAG: hypothetical protein QOF43_781, partial [Gaiellaceae bacterium]|nr:hypothetical protein [Gaiellaceae bacterium]
FNNVMTAVSGCSDLLLEEIEVNDPRRRRVEVISQSAGRATELTRQLLAFSRRQVLRLEPVDLAQLVNGIRPILEQLLPPNIDLCCDLTDGAVARIDRPQLEQVLLNLALNARDAMSGGGGKLRISVRALDSAAELSVIDEGVGMDEQTKARIFEPFFTTKQTGTGLGLSMVDGVVAQSGGTVSVESASGLGSAFTIRLPRVHEPAVEPEPALNEPAAAATGRVLLTDDDELVRRVTTEMLRRAGYDVISVASGEEALAVLRADHGFDALVTDVSMTGMDGRTLSLRARESQPSLPVLFISGYPAEVLSGDRMIAEGDEVLTKPFTAADLAERVELVRNHVAGLTFV